MKFEFNKVLQHKKSIFFTLSLSKKSQLGENTDGFSNAISASVKNAPLSKNFLFGKFNVSNMIAIRVKEVKDFNKLSNSVMLDE